MLVLSRRIGERIRIGDDIELVVIATHRSSVKIGICAPEHVTVMRSEIVDDYSDDNPQTTEGE